MLTPPSSSSERISVTVSPAHLQLALGDRAEVTVTVQNRGGFVDQFELQVEGLDPAWVAQDVRRVSLFPGDEGHLELGISLPTDRSIPAGLRHVRLKVFSWYDPGHATFVDLGVEILPVGGLELSLSPQLVTTRRTGQFRITLTNVGNAEQVVDLAATDPEEALDLLVEADRVGLAPGTTEEIGLRARPRRRRLIAPPVRHPFTVTALPAGLEAAEPLATTEGTLVYRAPLVFLAKMLPWVAATARVVALMAVISALGAWVIGSPGLPGPTVEEVQPTRTPIVLSALLPPTAEADAAGDGTMGPDGSAAPGESGDATGAAGEASAGELPHINRFDLSVPPDATARELELSWEVAGADEVVVFGTPQPAEGSMRLPNAPEGQIDLTARNSAGEVSKTIGLLVLRAPEVVEFRAEPEPVAPGQTTTLSWELRRADTATLFGPGLPSSGQAIDAVTGKLDVQPQRAGTYRLVADNDLGRIERLLVVRIQAGAGTPGSQPSTIGTPTSTGSAAATPSPVAAPPVIEQFGMVAPIDDPDGSLPLEWQVAGADEVRLVRSDPVSSTPEPFQVVESTEYTLMASGGGESARDSLTLYVARAPRIEQFTAEPGEIRPGEWVRLSWQVSGADRVFLDGQPVEATAQGVTYSRPYRTHEYVLHAENAIGTTTRRASVGVKP